MNEVIYRVNLVLDQDRNVTGLDSSYELTEVGLINSFRVYSFSEMPYFNQESKAYGSPTWFNTNTRIYIRHSSEYCPYFGRKSILLPRSIDLGWFGLIVIPV